MICKGTLEEFTGWGDEAELIVVLRSTKRSNIDVEEIVGMTLVQRCAAVVRAFMKQETSLPQCKAKRVDVDGKHSLRLTFVHRLSPARDGLRGWMILS